MPSKTSWFDWFNALVFIGAFGVVAVRLEATAWTSNLAVVEVLVFIACVLGLLLGASRLSSLASQLFALNYTLFFIPWQLGLVGGSQLPADERLLNMFGRLSFSITEVLNNRPIQDPLLFIASMSLFLWILSLLAGYQLARHGRPWVPVLLMGLALAVIDFYTPYLPHRDRYSGFFVFLVLLMVARTYLLHSRKKWFEKGMAVDPEIGYDLGRTVAISGLVLVLLAWNVPTIVDALTPGTTLQKQLAKQWDSVRNRFQNAVAGLQNPVSVTSDYYGSELSLGTGGASGDEIVFTVQVVGGRPQDARFYWRARSFESYDGTQWLTNDSKPRTLPPNEWPFRVPLFTARKEVSLSIASNVTTMRNLYSAGIPLQVSRQADVLFHPEADGTTDVVALIANPPLRGGEVYQVRSWVAVPTVLDLKETTNKYPPEIKQIYLQLPDNLPARVSDLAKQITAGINNPYDQTMAITNWLRNNIDYELTIPPVPANRDILDWFLFDLKQGYCNYYATAEVVLLRSIGIPARLAVGYAEGEYEQAADSFTIRRRDSHAWPEVYFEEYGWVEFEPTVAQPQTDMPSGDPVDSQSLAGLPNNPGLNPDEFPSEEPQQMTGPIGRLPDQNSPRMILIILIPLSVGLIIALLFWLRRTNRLKFLDIALPVLVTSALEKQGFAAPRWLRNWANHTRLSPMEKLFSRINWMLLLVGRRPKPANTPAERIQQLITLAPNAEETATTFLTEYQKDEYSPESGDYPRAKAANRRLWVEVALGLLRKAFAR